MARQITPKQKAFADRYLKTGNGKQSALAVYDTDSEGVAATIASENLMKPNVINYLEAALPEELLAQKHKEGLEASYTDEWVDEAPDYSVRAKYLDMAYKLKGNYAAEKSINMNVNAKDLEATILADIARFRAKD